MIQVENNMENLEFNKKFDDRLREIMPNYLKTYAFTQEKLTDTPSDALSVVPRKYVTMNGSVAARPQNSVIAQFYFDSTNNQPMWRGSTGRFYNGVGSIIA